MAANRGGGQICGTIPEVGGASPLRLWNRRGQGRPLSARRGHRTVLASFLATVCLVTPILVTAGAAAARAAEDHVTKALSLKAPTYTWPEFGHDPGLSGQSQDPAISTTSAATLGTSWMAYTGAEALSSPVAAWNVTLHKTLVFVANGAGYVEAYDQSTGQQIWSVSLGSPIESTPVADGPDLWVAPSADQIYKLNAATGAVDCSTSLAGASWIGASPTIATPPGGRKTVYIGANDSHSKNGPLFAISAASCRITFAVSPEPASPTATGGEWDPISYGVDAAGVGLVYFGTADPDSAVYAINAITGATIWRVATTNPSPGTFDIGAGVTVSPPGVNGFADGVVYADNKAGYVYALNMATGTPLWSITIGPPPSGFDSGGVSTPALSGTSLVVPDGYGDVYCLNALTGTILWKTVLGRGDKVDGEAAIVGPTNAQVIAIGDQSGMVRLLSLATGNRLYGYQTGDFVIASAADVNGNLLDVSGDGYLYDFAPGGGNGGAPSTAVTAPGNLSVVTNPNGSLLISGSAAASADTTIQAVQVAIQQGGSKGTWWDSVTDRWNPAPYGNAALLSTPGGVTSSWSLSLPVPASGGQYAVLASAVNNAGTEDISSTQSPPTNARVSFYVQPSTTAPVFSVSSPWVSPGGSVTVSGSGFAPSESVAISLTGSVLSTVTTNAAGVLPTTSVTIPPTTAFGPMALDAVGQTSQSASSAPLYVTDSWPQFQAGPAHPGTTTNNNALQQAIAVDHSSYLLQSWAFASSSPIRTSPSIVDGVAFFGNDAGMVYAVNVVTGAAVWGANVGGGLAIDSSPAVDMTAGSGLVVFGTTTGSVVALNAANGLVQWSRTLDGSSIESSPTVVGNIVYIASDSGTVAALNEATGVVLWTTTLPGTTQSSPAVDVKSGILVVGDNSGAVTALSTTSGVRRWQTVTGGAISSAPLIAPGQVYFSSRSGSIYDVTEKTGVVRWSTGLGGPVVAAPALTGTTLLAGDASGQIDWISSTTGAILGTQSVGSGVVGISTIPGFMVADLSNGTVVATKGPHGPSAGGWSHPVDAALDSSPSILNDEVFITGMDGALHCFTLPGSAPA